jgi:clorobiocin/coumermycin A biosynthesis protein CloN7/CouN7
MTHDHAAKHDAATHFLDVPGARLCYEVRGSGPLLLLAGPMASRGFAPLVPGLADHHTVVTYDPRGMLRSTVEDPDRPVSVELLADDVHRLLSALGTEPVDVFANSGATAVALEVAVRNPGRISTLVAHEPPLVSLLADAAAIQAAFDDVRDTYVRVGRTEALKKYAALTGVDRYTRPRGGGKHEVTDLDTFRPTGDVAAVLDRFFVHFMQPTTAYRPDLAALRDSSLRIVVGTGVDTTSGLARRATVAFAEGIGVKVVDFPGDHIGFQSDPEAFAEVLEQVLSEAR